MHLLKAGAKPVPGGKKRRRHEVFDPGNDGMQVVWEEHKNKQEEPGKNDGFQDVTSQLKKTGRGRVYNPQPT